MTAGLPDWNGVTSPTKLAATHACPEGWQVSVGRSVVGERARCDMLTITALGDAEYVISGVAVGIDEYYVGEGEAPGVWHGRLAGELGLEGIVAEADLRALVLGDQPGTHLALLGGHRRRTVAAIDLTFSAPKSVSLLWAFAGPEVSAAASIAHAEAVAVALDFLERRAGATRQMIGRTTADPDGHGGGDVRPPDEPGGRPSASHPCRRGQSRPPA